MLAQRVDGAWEIATVQSLLLPAMPADIISGASLRSAADANTRHQQLQSVKAAGQTAHSMRRSAFIHSSQQGASTEQLLDKGLMSMGQVLKRRYSDPARHTTASQRAPRKRQSR